MFCFSFSNQQWLERTDYYVPCETAYILEKKFVDTLMYIYIYGEREGVFVEVVLQV